MLTFRPHQKKDIPYRVKWLNDPRVNKYLNYSATNKTTLAREQAWFADYLKNRKKMFFTICEQGQPIGLVGLLSINRTDRTAEAFIMIGEYQCRGKGLGRQAMQYIIDYGFKKLKLHKISLEVFRENEKGVQCFQKSGFKTEGVLKDECYFAGKHHDLVRMAIFNPDK